MAGDGQISRPEPDAEVKKLGKLVGTWRLSGEATGTLRYEWLTGGFFLLQHVDMTQGGHHIRGLEVIGRLLLFGEDKPGLDIKSRFYGDQGEAFDYVYEMSEDAKTLTIWGGEKGSPAYFRGTFNDDDSTLAGAWIFPGGGGYEAVSTRVG